MKKELLYTMPSPCRDDFKVYGYRFGEGKRALAVMGAIRGDEVQQLYTAALLVKTLERLERKGALMPDVEILVIPCVNPFSMNIAKRFWSMDNTDINRMFPGYDKGETTQRIAGAIFDCVKDYEFGIHLASNYIPGEFIPHVRVLNTGFQSETEASCFGLPYVFTKEVTPYDTTLLCYNWQLWGAKAFSLYTGCTNNFDEKDMSEPLEAIQRFMQGQGLLKSFVRPGYKPEFITNGDMITLRSKCSGLLRQLKKSKDTIHKGELLAEIIDPYDASIRESIYAPVSGVIFFNHAGPLALEGAHIFEIVQQKFDTDI